MRRRKAWQAAARHQRADPVRGAELDLTQAVFTDNVCEINVFCLFGGIEITVPDGTTVRNECVAVFGGSDTKTMPHARRANRDRQGLHRVRVGSRCAASARSNASAATAAAEPSQMDAPAPLGRAGFAPYAE